HPHVDDARRIARSVESRRRIEFVHLPANIEVMEIAIIVPVYNEEDNVLPMAREVSEAMKTAGRSYELVFVDDASTDSTWKRIGEARSQFPNVRGLRHAVNSGQSAALWTGIKSTNSEIIATLDGDLQNDPADI